MKWLIIQSAGCHPENLDFRECYAWEHALQECFQEVHVWGKRHINFSETPDFESYDVILCLEQYELEWLPAFNQIRKPIKIQWLVDLHCQPISRYARILDHCHIALHATRKYVEISSKIKHVWCPNAVDGRLFNYSAPGFSEIRFLHVGSQDCGPRAEYIKRLQEDCGLQCKFIRGQGMVDAILSARVHFNKNVGCDINYRHFETIGLGTCLLTEWNEDLERLNFVDGKNCLLYRTYDEAVSKFRDVIQDNRWQEIGNNGRELAVSHTYTQRIRSLLQIL